MINTTKLSSTRRNSMQWPMNLTCPSFPSKLVIVMIGLPARGKSYISKKLKRYLKWIGFHCRIFNAGDYRRTQIGTGQTADFYDPNNKECRKQKRQIAMTAFEDLLVWLRSEEDNFVGIFDATNSTKARRRLIVERCQGENCKVLFLESICTAEKILEQNYALKLQNDDYKSMDPVEARRDFEARVEAYETIYETLDQEDSDLSYIKLINGSDQIVTNGCSGYMLSQITTYLPNLHITPKKIYLTRHGQSMDNFSERIGGNAHLTDTGREYAHALRQFILAQEHTALTCWTSTLDRAVETAMPFRKDESIHCYQTRLLNEIYAGICEGMTYAEIEAQYPDDYAARLTNKLEFRYAQGGESYIDVMERVKPLLLELERHRASILVISHRAVLRTILAYFCEMDRDEMVSLDIPLHCVIQLTLDPFGCQRWRNGTTPTRGRDASILMAERLQRLWTKKTQSVHPKYEEDDSEVIDRYNESDDKKRVSVLARMPTDLITPKRTGWILKPNSAFTRRWDAVMVMLLTFTAIVTPFEVSFLESKYDALFVVNRWVDCLFFIDMIINFFLVYFDEDKGQWVNTRPEIARHYLSTWFMIDFISIIPIDIITLEIPQDGMDLDKLRLLRIVRLMRLMKLLRILRSARIFKRIQQQLGFTFATVALIKFIVAVGMIVHWIACLWNLTEGLVANEYPSNWKQDSAYFDETTSTPFATYLACVEVSIMFMVMSYGRFAPANVFESFIAIVSMLLAGSVYAYVIGSICSVVSMRDPATQEYQQTMDLLNSYMHEIKLPQVMKENLRSYFAYCRQLFRTKYYHQILEGMSPTLRGQVADHLHSQWIQKIPFFNAPSAEERYRFMIAVAVKLFPAVFAPNEKIFVVGDMADCMYIVQKGLVAGQGHIYSKGRFFGEDMILQSSRRRYEIRALTYIDLYVLSEADLYEILSKGTFKQTQRLIRKAAIRIAFKNKIKEILSVHRILNICQPRISKQVFEEERARLLCISKLMQRKSVRRLSLLHGGIDPDEPLESALGKVRRKSIVHDGITKKYQNLIKFWVHGDNKARMDAIDCDDERQHLPTDSDVAARLDSLEDAMAKLTQAISQLTEKQEEPKQESEVSRIPNRIVLPSLSSASTLLEDTEEMDIL